MEGGKKRSKSRSAPGPPLTQTPGQRDLLLTPTFGVVLFTLVIQGLSVRPLLERLGLASTEHARYDLERVLGRLRTTEAAAREVEALGRAHAIDAHLAQQYAVGREELRATQDATYHRSAPMEREHEREVRRHMLHVQRAAARDALARGQIWRRRPVGIPRCVPMRQG
jgi:CPA1 family monovalent cation:H+ antiporter